MTLIVTISLSTSILLMITFDVRLQQFVHNGLMSSEDVATYLYEVGSNERKLQYCRQILASNPSFTPEAIFNLNSPQPRTSIARIEFAELVKRLGVALTPQEVELVFGYFQIDGKNYLTLEEFSGLVAPQADPSLRSLMSRRRDERLTVDYAIKYGLQKFFGQVVEGQVRLELLCKFTFEKENEEKAIKYKRATAEAMKEFMAAHGKFPGEAETALILKEINLSKGEGKRNRLISEYILAFNEKKRTNQQAPPVYQRQPAAVANFKAKFQATIQQHESIANSRLQTALKPEFSRFFSKPPPPQQQAPQQRQSNQIAAKSSRKEFTSSISNVSQVEERIKTLMNSINIRSTSKKDEELSKRQEDVPKITDKEKSSQSGQSRSISKKIEFKDKESFIKEIYSNQNRSQKRDLTDRSKTNINYEAYTDKGKQYGRKRIEYLRNLVKQN